MKRILLAYILLLSSLLCACGAGSETDTDTQTEGYYDTAFTLADAEKAALAEETAAAAETCSALYQSMDQSTTLNTVLDKDTITAMVRTLGDAGYTAIDSNNTIDLTNPEPMQAFLAAFEAGTSAEASYYVVYEDGSLCRFLLRSDTDGEWVITVPVCWDSDGVPQVERIAKYSVLDISYTEKGYLIYERDISNYRINKKFTLIPHTLLRLEPQDAVCRTLCETYIRPIGYLKNNCFLTSWDQNSLEAIDFNYLYHGLYGLYYDCDPLHFFTPDSGYSLVPGTDLFAVPAAVFETVVGQYFDLSPEQLQSMAVYDTEGDFYPIYVPKRGFAPVPVPEVTAYWYNEDGTLTMQVEAVFPKEGTDCAFRHDVTVAIADDGSFHYVSNRFYDRKENILPNAQTRISDEISRHYGT